jgi:hypothetical protein
MNANEYSSHKLYDVYEVINYNLCDAYLWEPQIGSMIGTYDRETNHIDGYVALEVETTHSCGYPGFFKPDVSETKRQIDGHVAYFTSRCMINERGYPELIQEPTLRQRAHTLLFIKQ